MKGLFTDVEMNSDNVKVTWNFIFWILVWTYDAEIVLFSASYGIQNSIKSIKSSLRLSVVGYCKLPVCTYAKQSFPTIQDTHSLLISVITEENY